MNQPKVVGNEFHIADQVVKFPCDIAEFAEANDIYVVLLSSSSNLWTHDNVYGVGKDGSIIWKLQDVSKVFPIDNDVPYVGFNIVSSSLIRVINFNGVSLSVDTSSGRIVGKDVPTK